MDNKLPNVAKQLRAFGGYQTAMVGKWHLGEGKVHEPTGFDYWEVVPGQGQYFDPLFINPEGMHKEYGYATDLTTDKAIDFISKRDTERPFFVQVHHKAPHRSWEYHPKHKDLYKDEIKLPDTFSDDYKTRAKAASVATMKVTMDMTYLDLGLVQPEGGQEVGELVAPEVWHDNLRKIPFPENVTTLRPLMDKETGEKFTFKTRDELAKFKYQRYMQRYLRTVQSIDDNVGRLLDFLDKEGLAENTMVLYTSDQGFFLGWVEQRWNRLTLSEHGWFDKRFIYEESFQMPLMIRCPGLIKPGTVSNDIISNVDFAPTWLEYAGLRIPTFMQGESFLSSLSGASTQSEDQVAYHRYWMHADNNHNAYVS
jgi:arylsulfatase A-like enzyme